VTDQRAAMSPREMREDWETPPEIFAPLHREFQFTLDAAADVANAKVSEFYSVEQDSLKMRWAPHRVWLNPPYGHRSLREWMAKAYAESLHGALVVCLVPAYTGQVWWHESVVDKAGEIRWIKGKIRFVGARHHAPFASCVVIYHPWKRWR
jgi:phage N-6-adenine-methyltransferase